ncbi:MAG: choice-of-anchor D domain-containing protein, partial [Chromatiales bacterium]|nr:choice-of-anchor D domain-containing protein [Chromatiales bacterium]
MCTKKTFRFVPLFLMMTFGLSAAYADDRISMAEHAMALGADGLLWSWGDNDYSQVDPDSVDDVVATPTLICPETNTGPACVAFRASTGTVQRLVASNDYSLMLKGGRVWSWGDNGSGYLGDGTEDDRPHPVPVCRADAQTIPCGTDEQLTGIVDIDANAATLAITDAGKLLSWGYGPLGRDTGSVPYTLPGEVCPEDDVASDCAGFRAAGAAIDVALTWDVALVVKADGTVWAWGNQYYGVIGNDQQSADNILRPSRVCVNGGGQCAAFDTVSVRAVAAKGNHALALREDDTIWGWGDNFYGQVGDGTGTMRLTPVQVCPDSDLTDDCNAFRGAAQDSGIQQIAAGYVHSMALTGDGRVWAWGNNSDGQMGDGMVDDRPRPHEVCPVSDVSDECVAFRAAGPVQEISGRYDSNAALTEDGRLWTWGNNYAGTLGHGTSGPDSGARLPQPVIGYDAIGGRLDLELHRPTNQAPADGANAANPVVLDTAAYQHDAPSAPAHGGTQWQVSKSSGFSTLVLDTTFVSAAQMFSPAALNGQSLGELAVGETYWWRARHRTENGDWSYWSTPTSFTVLESSGANLSDTSLDFGSVAVGANSATQSVTLTNDGGSALNLTGVNVYGDYAIVSNACAPFPRVLNASQQCAIELRFSPTATGVREGLLSITSDHAASPHAVNLTGTGTAAAPTPAPALSLSPTDHDFGSVAVGATSDAQAIALTNIGTATLSGITLQLLGDYQQVSSTCGATLAASGSCTVDVRFAPTGTGARPGGRVVSSDAEESPHVAYFQGTGTAAGSVPAPTVSLTPSTLTFVAQTVGTVSAAQTVTLRNDGDAPLTSIDVEVYGTFSVESN